MLIDRVLADLDVPDPEGRAGNAIRGSRLGRCARQSAYLLFPGAFPPAPLPARAKLVFKFGDLVHEFIRAELRRVTPGEWGAEEERFHFRVELTVKQAKACEAHIRARRLVGTVEKGLNAKPDARRGLVLNLAEPALYVPLHVDGIADAGAYGLASVEIKSMATGSFLRALKGHVEYSYRVQMAAALEATHLDTQMLIACRKETSHLLEVVYSRKVDTVTIRFTKQSRLIKVKILEGRDGHTVGGDSGATQGWDLLHAAGGTDPGDPGPLGVPPALGPDLGQADWEAAEVCHPFEPRLLDEARGRVRRILLATPTNLPAREYGPSFACPTCEATGRQERRKGTGEPLKRGPRPCGDCEATGTLTEAPLPWQCRYCAFVGHCWPTATLSFDEGERPVYTVTREEVEGIAVQGVTP